MMFGESTQKVTARHYQTEKKFKLVDFKDGKAFDTEADDGSISMVSYLNPVQRRHMNRLTVQVRNSNEGLAMSQVI